MAQLQNTSITGSFIIGTTSDVSVTGSLWFNTSNNTLFYSTNVGGTIVSRSINLG